MANSYPSPVHLWEESVTALVQDWPASAGNALAGPHSPAQFAEQLYAWEALDPSASCPPTDEAAKPYTLQWFLDIENQRHGRQGRWIPRLLEFAKHSGETLLGLGNGLGTDWLQYARHGAAVVVCSPASEHLALVRKNFELRGLKGRFLHAPPIALPVETASVDVACISSLLHKMADPEAMVHEVYRVLKPGGKVLVVAPAKYDVDFCYRTLCHPWLNWLELKASQDQKNLGYSARRLRKLFGAFVEPRIYKRHLRRSEVPHVWRWLPLTFLERALGRVLVLKAFKPLSAALAVQLAA